MSGLAAFLNSDPWQLCSPAAATSKQPLPASNHSIPCIRLVLTGEQTSSVVCLAIDRRLQNALNEMRIRSMCVSCGQSRNGNLFRRRSSHHGELRIFSSAFQCDSPAFSRSPCTGRLNIMSISWQNSEIPSLSFFNFPVINLVISKLEFCLAF